MSVKIRRFIFCVVAVIGLLIGSCIIMYFVSQSGDYPSGSDTMYHIYRGKYLFNNIQQGNWYPVYNSDWYNGVELMRYWAPLGAFVSVGCELFSQLLGGISCPGVADFFNTIHLSGAVELKNTIANDEFGSYIIFTGLIFFAGAIVWMIIGMKINRPVLGLIIGILWYFMPNNLYALYGEGNLARSVSMIFLPLFLFGVYQFLKTRKTRFLVLISISFSLVTLCHLGYAGMVALSLILFIVLDMIINRRFFDNIRVIIATVFGFTLPGLWVITYLFGGVSSVHSLENTKGFFQNILISINPLYRYEVGNITFYFGLAAIIVAIAGAIFGYKKTRPGFLVGIITLILSTETMYLFVSILPGKENLWMLRFISIALCFILMSLIEWKTLRKPFIVIFIGLLVLDTIPSLSLIYGDMSGKKAEDNFSEYEVATLIKSAKEKTNQRLCIMDESTLGSRAAYLASYGKDGVKTTFGAGWEAAETSSNISNLNKALSEGKYLYMFDRCLELGNDTVLVKLSQLYKGTKVSDLDAAAATLNYKVVDENDGYRLYSLKQEGTWGLINEYRAIGIGTASSTVSRDFPAVEETQETNLNKYTFEELKDYDLIYLSGFDYDDKEAAEKLISDLSEAGVHIVICADGIPEDRVSHNQSFLGVVCNPISFSQGYPLLRTIDGELDTDLFPADNREWNTVYCNGLDDVWGTVEDDNYEIPFYGTVKNDNIVVIGLNLTYYLSLTKDESVEALLSHAMDLSPTELPKRTITPVEIEYYQNGMVINTASAGVNTTISHHKMFNSDKPIERKNNLLVVNDGETTIEYEYPYFIEGLLVSLGTVAIMCIYFYLVYIKLRDEKEPKETKEEDDFYDVIDADESVTRNVSKDVMEITDEMGEFNDIENIESNADTINAKETNSGVDVLKHEELVFVDNDTEKGDI